MYVRLKQFCVISAAVTALFGGTTIATAEHQGHAFNPMKSVHLAAACKPGQVDACKPSGCCIVDVIGE
jgi:hypothetical protein